MANCEFSPFSEFGRQDGIFVFVRVTNSLHVVEFLRRVKTLTCLAHDYDNKHFVILREVANWKTSIFLATKIMQGIDFCSS